MVPTFTLSDRCKTLDSALAKTPPTAMSVALLALLSTVCSSKTFAVSIQISAIPSNPTKKIEAVRKLLKKDKNFQEVIDLYEMFRKIEELRKERIGEFRKNVNLRVFYRGKEININLEMLKVYADMLEKFISTTKQFLLR